MTFGKDMYYFLLAMMLFVGALLLIPKFLYKKFFIYGFLLGGVPNVALIVVAGGVFHLFKYLNLGPLGIWGLFSIWTPVAWTFTFMLYLYFLPVRKFFYYPYILCFAFLGYLTGQALKGLGLFVLQDSYAYFEPLTFIIWFGATAWIYYRAERVALK